jgi:hypothetical protein
MSVHSCASCSSAGRSSWAGASVLHLTSSRRSRWPRRWPACSASLCSTFHRTRCSKSIGDAPLSPVYDWRTAVATAADVVALRRDYPEVNWHTLDGWASRQNWHPLTTALSRFARCRQTTRCTWSIRHGHAGLSLQRMIPFSRSASSRSRLTMRSRPVTTFALGSHAAPAVPLPDVRQPPRRSRHPRTHRAHRVIRVGAACAACPRRFACRIRRAC